MTFKRITYSKEKPRALLKCDAASLNMALSQPQFLCPSLPPVWKWNEPTANSLLHPLPPPPRPIPLIHCGSGGKTFRQKILLSNHLSLSCFRGWWPGGALWCWTRCPSHGRTGKHLYWPESLLASELWQAPWPGSPRSQHLLSCRRSNASSGFDSWYCEEWVGRSLLAKLVCKCSKQEWVGRPTVAIRGHSALAHRPGVIGCGVYSVCFALVLAVHCRDVELGHWCCWWGCSFSWTPQPPRRDQWASASAYVHVPHPHVVYNSSAYVARADIHQAYQYK